MVPVVGTDETDEPATPGAYGDGWMEAHHRPYTCRLLMVSVQVSMEDGDERRPPSSGVGAAASDLWNLGHQPERGLSRELTDDFYE